MRRVPRLLMLVMLWTLSGSALAQEQEVRGGNREVVERLVRVEEGQKALAQQLESINTSLNKRIDDLRAEMTQRFDDVNRRFDDVNRRFDDVNRRFDDVNRRFDDVMTLLQIVLSALVALVLAVAGAGFVMWRKILAVDAVVQTKIGLDQAVRDQVARLEQEVGFVKGKLRELAEAIERR